MSETEPERYSEKRLKDSFTAYVLLTDDLEFRPSEILEAVREDYPGLAWTDKLELDTPFKTGEVSLAVFFTEEEHNEPGVVHMSSFPGQCDVDWGSVLHNAQYSFPNASEVINRHKTYLSVTVGSVDQTLAARFDAARRATCLAAVFAKLPICSAVYFPSGDTIVQPDAWVEAADTAMQAKFPMLQWISLPIIPVPDGKEPVPVSLQTIGMAAFNGHEIFMPLVRMHPSEAGPWVLSAAHLLLERGHVFQDSNTLGMEDSTEKPIRIRHMPEGMMGAQTDMWALLHEKTTLDEMEVFGEHSRPPPPPGVDNTNRGDPDSLRKKLYKFVTGSRGK